MIRLYELRTEKNLSQRDIAKQFNISQSTYHNWENDKTQPTTEQLIQIAQFFGVSVDYLIGNSDDCGIINYDDSYLRVDEVELLGHYNALPDNARKNILDFIKNIKSNI